MSMDTEREVDTCARCTLIAHPLHACKGERICGACVQGCAADNCPACNETMESWTRDDFLKCPSAQDAFIAKVSSMVETWRPEYAYYTGEAMSDLEIEAAIEDFEDGKTPAQVLARMERENEAAGERRDEGRINEGPTLQDMQTQARKLK